MEGIDEALMTGVVDQTAGEWRPYALAQNVQRLRAHDVRAEVTRSPHRSTKLAKFPPDYLN